VLLNNLESTVLEFFLELVQEGVLALLINVHEPDEVGLAELHFIGLDSAVAHQLFNLIVDPL